MMAFQSNQNSNNLYNNFLELKHKFDSTNTYIIGNSVIPAAGSKNNEVFKSSNTNAVVNISPKPLNQNQYLPSVQFVSMLISLLIISFILIGYLKYLKVFIQSLFYNFIAEKTLDDFSVPFVKVSRMLDFLSVFSSILLSITLFQFFTNDIPILFILIPTLVLIVYRIWIWLLHRILAISTYKIQQVNYLYFQNTLILRILMLFLVPLILMSGYTAPPLKNVFVYVSILLIALALLYRYLLFGRIFIKQRVSLLYFILYLCALELPIVLGITYFMRVN
jgi:hypothetical protein